MEKPIFGGVQPGFLLVWLLVVFGVLVGGGVALREAPVVPVLKIDTGEGVRLVYYNRPVASVARCDVLLDLLENSIKAPCSNCQTLLRECAASLPPSQDIYFTSSPVSHPIAHFPKGVMVFEAENPSLGLSSCQSTASVINRNSIHPLSRCYPAEAPHPYFKATGERVSPLQFSGSVWGGIAALLASLVFTFFIIRYEHLHASFTHDHLDSGPQKFHAVATPRIGGVSLMLGLMVSALILLLTPYGFDARAFGLLLVASLPAFLGGVVEDLTKSVSVLQRLLLTMLSGLIGAWLLGGILTSLGLPLLDTLLQWGPFALLFTAFAVGGVANAINIIDGCNGLAAGFGIIASAALALVAAQHGDALLMYAGFAMAGALVGFLAWNWPGGRIFLGDGGAYLLGFWLAELSILLVVRNPAVSVWFPLLVLIYPVFETLFSVYRRKILHKAHPGLPDAMHMHQMFYKRMVRLFVGSRDAANKTLRNSLVAPYFWVTTLCFSAFGVLVNHRTDLLLAASLLFCLCYVGCYRILFRWRLPSWLNSLRWRESSRLLRDVETRN